MIYMRVAKNNRRQILHVERKRFPIALVTLAAVLLQRLGSRARVCWVDLATRPI